MTPSVALAVPTRRDAVRALDSPTLYVLERAGEIAREILDARIIDWTAQGWTQQKIAEEIGCSRPAISKRQARLGVQPSEPHPPRGISNRVTNSENGSDAEVMPGQLVLPERTDRQRLHDLRARHNDLAARVQTETLSLEEAEYVADERERRVEVWASEVRRAISVLVGLAGHPVPAGLSKKLDQHEQATLALLLAGVPAEEQT